MTTPRSRRAAAPDAPASLSGFDEPTFAGIVMLPAAGLLLLAALVAAVRHRWGRPRHLAANLRGTLSGCVVSATGLR